MSVKVNGPQIANVTDKWELAIRVAGNSKSPEQALKSLFKGIISGFEQHANTSFDENLKERVWSKVSAEKLTIVKEALYFEFCDTILNTFNEVQAKEMLEEHKNTGYVRHPIYSVRLKTASSMHYQSIVDAVVQKADSMKAEWVPQIFEALKQEGISFSKD